MSRKEHFTFFQNTGKFVFLDFLFSENASPIATKPRKHTSVSSYFGKNITYIYIQLLGENKTIVIFQIYHTTK